MFIGNLFVVCLFSELLQLSCGILSGFDGIHYLYAMSRRIVLRLFGPHRCYGKLLFRILFSSLCNRVFELPCWFFPSDCRLFKLHSMSRRVVLRHRGSDCSDRSLRSW